MRARGEKKEKREETGFRNKGESYWKKGRTDEGG